MEGRSLLPAMAGSAGRSSLYLAYTDKQRGIRTERWKLIEYVVNGRHAMTQLFDLRRDPWEIENLAFTAAARPVLKRLRRQMLHLREEWDDRRTPWGKIFWQGYKEKA
ncbi:MAG: DUF4976 domain-containing protein [Planctomycetota bacterium]|nr:DUF4976 domain-containing protein [Planctomycetota bacterium]